MFFFRKKIEQKNEKEKMRVHIFVSGRVQGIFFRENTKKKAEKLAISGWVKNLRDGRLEAIFEGDRENIEKMVNWAKKGPIWAKIDDFSLVWEDYLGQFKDFEIRYDL